MNKFIFLFSRLSIMALFFLVLKFFQIEPGLIIEEREISNNSDLKSRTNFIKDTSPSVSSTQVELPEKEKKTIQINNLGNKRFSLSKKENMEKKGLSLVIGNKLKEREFRAERRARYVENLAKRRVYEKKYNYKKINNQEYIITNDLVAVKSEGKSNSNIEGYDIKHISRISDDEEYFKTVFNPKNGNHLMVLNEIVVRLKSEGFIEDIIDEGHYISLEYSNEETNTYVLSVDKSHDPIDYYDLINKRSEVEIAELNLSNGGYKPF